MQDFVIDSKLLAMQELGESFRHSLHKIPEVSGAEFKTSAFCQDVLKKAGFTITTFEGYTGFLADLDSQSENTPRIAIRADMDALEMSDLTQNEHTSTHKGLAHNCGHDLHMAIALLSGCFIAKHKEKLPCNVRFIFQMAEEKAHIPGANKMVELGCMEGVDEVYALHNDASLEYGSVKINNGIMSSFGTIWSLSIQGKAAHSSTPQKGLDAIREGARILADMDYIVAKKTDPFSVAVFSCGMFQGGSIPNGVAESALLKGTIRAMDSKTDEILKNAFKEIEEQSALRGFKTKFSYDGYLAIFNHTKCVKRLVESAQKVLKKDEMLIQECEPMSASEDFSEMINACKDKKGAMYFLGSGNKAKGICNYLHSNPYYVEDKAILVGAQIWINLILSFGK
ncbi:M20 metallopeptidase family protein [Helicobacter labetoulli]|uniref:M20 metallopeptidase family protein n=1 Tax=Helicobacter labetoulli TaxID=2315333 RepID=UPI000EF6CE07|nr:M20 family metallopeptidase [Helicobacter labetoulli]